MKEWIRMKRKPHGRPTIDTLTTNERVPSPLERKRKRAARKRNKIAAASRRKNR